MSWNDFLNALRLIKRRARDRYNARIDNFLKDCRRIVHVGANVGQEAELYARHGLGVLWIEPIPALYEQLCRNIAKYNGQQAIQALVADAEGRSCVLNVASNKGESSSIFDLAQHADIWPDIRYVDRITLTTHTLDKLVPANLRPVDALVIDTQGAELLVLKGAEGLLREVRYVKAEAAAFEAYAGAATMDGLIAHMAPRGFRLVKKARFAKHASGLGYFDLLFKRR